MLIISINSDELLNLFLMEVVWELGNYVEICCFCIVREKKWVRLRFRLDEIDVNVR